MNNAKGGVTPLKKRGGKAARKVTAKKTGKGVVSGYKGRGGYKKSGGGKNPGGYNVHTRFKPRAKQEGPKGGGGGSADPTSNKPYSYDKDGNIVINNNNYINTAGGTNKNENINKNINTNINNEKPENDKIKENEDRFGKGWEHRHTPGKTTKTTDTDLLSIWESNTSKEKYYGKMTEGERYMKYGHSNRMTEDQFNSANFKHGSYMKDGKTFHTSFEGYAEYMNFRNSMSESEKAETKTSKSNRVRTTTSKGKNEKRSYDENLKTKERTNYSDWEEY